MSESAVRAGVPTIVAFEHPAFGKLENLHFRLSEATGEPVAMVSLGANEAALSLRGLRREFAIVDDSRDGRMLDLVARALFYVKGLRPGDALPKEIVTREASWQCSERHRVIAYQRLTMQLVSWLYGEEHLITDPDALAQVADDPQTKKRVNQAFDEVAERLGLDHDRRHEIVGHIQALSQELAYIEALRDQFLHLKAMERKIQGLRKLYGHERSVLEVADPVARLARLAVADFQAMFDEVDAQTGEIIGALKNIDAHFNYIRAKRDDLHRRLMAWDELLREWRDAKLEVAPDKPDLLRKTYRFLAPRFMQVDEWVLMTRPQPHGGGGRDLLAPEPAKKPIGGSMAW